MNDAVTGCNNDAKDKGGVGPHEETSFLFIRVVDQSLEGINRVNGPFIQEIKGWQGIMYRKGFHVRVVDLIEFLIFWQGYFISINVFTITITVFVLPITPAHLLLRFQLILLVLLLCFLLNV